MAKKKEKKDDDNVTNGFLDLVERYVRNQAEIKEMYEEQEQLLNDIITSGVKPGVVFEIEVGSSLVPHTIKDNFADTNIIFRSCAAKRFDIVEVKAKKGKK